MVGRHPVSIIDVVMILALVFLIGGCAPAATSVLNTATGDNAELVFVVDDVNPCGVTGVTGLCFVPGDQPALGVIVDVIADDALAFDEAVCTATGFGADCRLGDVEEARFVDVGGVNVTAQATYRRPDSNRVYREFAVR